MHWLKLRYHITKTLLIIGAIKMLEILISLIVRAIDWMSSRYKEGRDHQWS